MDKRLFSVSSPVIAAVLPALAQSQGYPSKPIPSDAPPI
jgi:hypothetical protein